MSNLTFDHRLLKEHTPEPLEGHAVVVFARVGEAGDELHSVLLPGAAPVKPGLALPFRKRTEYFAYAVDTSPERHLDFTESMRLADRMFEFRVVFNLAYAVSDTRALARARNLDPLRKVRDQVRVVVKREVELLPRHALGEAFPQHARVVVEGCMDELREHAASYGIEIRSLRLTVRLPEDIEGVYQEEHLGVARRESEQRLTNHDRILDMQSADLADAALMVNGSGRLKATLMDTTIAAAGRGEIGTMQDLIKQLNTLHAGGGGVAGVGGGIGGGVGGGGVGGDAGPQGLPPGIGNMRTLGAGTGTGTSAAGGALSRVLGDVVAATDVVRGPQRRKVRAALLHLAAEMLLDDLGDGAATARYAERARAAIAGLDPSPGGAELDALKALADPDSLRDRLEN